MHASGPVARAAGAGLCRVEVLVARNTIPGGHGRGHNQTRSEKPSCSSTDARSGRDRRCGAPHLHDLPAPP